MMKYCEAILLITSVIYVTTVDAKRTLSASMKESMTQDMLSRARDAGVPEENVNCLQKYARAFKPMTKGCDGEKGECYDHEEFGVHMSHALWPCVHELEASGQMRSIKVVPTSVRHGGHGGHGSKGAAKKFQCEKQKVPLKGKKKRCLSGVHYCCSLLHLGGTKYCFELFCGGKGCCA